ncbi:MAG: PHP domain-containing protein [Christensenellales bacterium]|jgi:putative hydrolase
MRLIADWHTHSRYSRHGHGKGTIAQNAQAALDRGLRQLAITDHGPAQMSYGLRLADLPAMRREVDAWNDAHGDQLEVLLGVEANFISLDGEIDVPEAARPYLDLVVAGYHKLVLARPGGRALFARQCVARGLLRRDDPAMARRATAMVVRALERGGIDILSHPGHDLTLEMDQVARAAAQSGALLEINTSHGKLDAGQLARAKALGARFCIDSDAHSPERVGDLAAGIALARRAGLTDADVANTALF